MVEIFLPQFFDWWQVSATVEVTKGLVLASVEVAGGVMPKRA